MSLKKVREQYSGYQSGTWGIKLQQLTRIK